MTDSQRDHRIHVLKDILLRLHHGASPESVQADFEAHFTGVSPIEVSLMEHELMNGDHGVSFEDVMKLCTVHAKVMAASVQGTDNPDSDQEGHPVWVFKQENLAFQAALHRIQRLLEALDQQATSGQPLEDGLLAGLGRQYALLGQFDRHYRRKEELFFPIMEGYGHDAPPKVMWGVDDQIRDLFARAQASLAALPAGDVASTIRDFAHFRQEFLDMIFKEEAILLPLLLSLFAEDDWLAIARDSAEFGYAIIQPEQTWVPRRQAFGQTGRATAGDSATGGPATDTAPAPTTTDNADVLSRALDAAQQAEQAAQRAEAAAQQAQAALQHLSTAPAGPAATPAHPNTEADLPFGGGYLTLKEANLILNHLPFEITFIDKDDLFKYFNTSVELEQKLFPRVPSAIGRHVKNCHPPRSLEMVMTLIDDLKHKRRTSESMWFHRSDGRFAYVTYIGVFDEDDHYMGVLEYVHDIAPLLDLGPDKRGLSPLEPNPD